MTTIYQRQQAATLDDVMGFGKYKGQSLGDILEHTPSYVMWLFDEEIITPTSELYDIAVVADANASPPEEYYWQPG